MIDRRRFLRTVTVTVLVLSVGSCDDPTRVRTPPTLDPQLAIMAVLDPDRTIQHVQVEPVDPTFELLNIRGRLYEDGVLVETDFAPAATERESPTRQRCGRTYRSALRIDNGLCLEFDYWPRHDAEYRVEVSADGFATASGTTRIPGYYRILSQTTSGSPPGTGGLDLRWSASAQAHRYTVSVLPLPDSNGCCSAWHTETDGLRFSGRVPSDELEGPGPWAVRVRSLGRGLYEYLTTGADGSFFTVAPIQNVEGGYGVVGGWTARDIVGDSIIPVVNQGDWQVDARPLPDFEFFPDHALGSRSGSIYVLRWVVNYQVLQWNGPSAGWAERVPVVYGSQPLMTLEDGVVMATLLDENDSGQYQWMALLIPDDGSEPRIIARLQRGWSNPSSAFIDIEEDLQIYARYPRESVDFALHRSTDGGETFDLVEVISDVAHGAWFDDIEESPVDGALYAVCSACAEPVFRSEDRGASWQSVGGLLEGSYRELEVASDGRIYIGGSGVQVSTDRGETWTRGSDEGIRDLLVNPLDPEQVWFTSGFQNRGVFESTDGGRTFHYIGLEHAELWGLIFNPELGRLYTVDRKKWVLALDIP